MDGIGYLVARAEGFGVICVECQRNEVAAPIYREHVIPSGCSCVRCGRVLCEPWDVEAVA